MANPQIHPHKVTKPIQLVAAWLAGLVVVNGMFLATAATIGGNGWIQNALVTAAIANVPIFLLAIFLLQTRFRAELQEDSYYSEYLSKSSSQVIRIDKNTEQDARIESISASVQELQRSFQAGGFNGEKLVLPVTNIPSPLDNWRIAVNRLHPQFKEIVAALNSAGITVAETFAAEKNAETPKRWVISISHHLPVTLQVRLLALLCTFEFEGFHRWEPLYEAEEYEDVYIGSYGNESIVPFTERLKSILASPSATRVLNAYYRNHSYNDDA
ncbi:hypothetical protein [Chromobacterium sp. CV08]|uniref:hypothetical protein n=1 Tax=Chromobacterium sp. CV08 TaxID=3133274 RepID=UPI003DA7B402